MPRSADRPAAVLQVLARLDDDERGRTAIDVARRLRARGWRSLVASAGGAAARELVATGTAHLAMPLDAAGVLSAWRNAGRLRRAIRDHGAALVHVRAATPARSAAAAARAAGIPLVATIDAPDLADAVRHGHADRVIVPSEYLADRVAEQGVPRDRLRLVRRWIDPAEFDPERVRGHRVLALGERWGIAPGPKTVLAPPLREGDRGHLLLVQALARLPRVDCQAVLVGGPAPGSDYAEELVRAVRRAGLGERVRFGAVTDDLPAAMSLANVVVLSATLPDPTGVTAAAAQAMGRPVIVTNRGALAESVLPAASGWLVPPDDATELARALELALALDEDTRRRLAERARAFARAEFGLEPMVDRELDVYRELLAAPAPAGAGHGARPLLDSLGT